MQPPASGPSEMHFHFTRAFGAPCKATKPSDLPRSSSSESGSLLSCGWISTTSSTACRSAAVLLTPYERTAVADSVLAPVPLARAIRRGEDRHSSKLNSNPKPGHSPQHCQSKSRSRLASAFFSLWHDYSRWIIGSENPDEETDSHREGRSRKSLKAFRCPAHLWRGRLVGRRAMETETIPTVDGQGS